MKSKFYIISFTLLSLILSISLASSEEFGYNYLTEENTLKNLNDVNITNASGQQVIIYNQTSGKWYNSYLNNSAHHVNASDYWITGDHGSLRNVAEILHSWLNSASLLWSNANHTMDTTLDMNNQSIINANQVQATTLNATGNIYGNGSTISNIAFETVNQVNKIGNPIHIDTLQEIYNHMYSAGVMHDCNITNNGDGTVNISAGYATLRATNDSHATLYSVDVNAQSNIALTDNRTNYVFLDWNGGSPQFNVGLSIEDFNCQDKCVGYIVSREGTQLDILDVREQNVDSNRKWRRRALETGGFVHVLGGSVISSSSLNISLTAGEFYYELTKTAHSAFDTSTGDSFTYYYTSDNGVTWTQVANETEINNLEYNDPGVGLVALGNNKYKVDWVYVINNEPSRLAVLYGQQEYDKLADAEAASIPEFAPDSISGLGALVGRVILQKSGIVMITESAFEQSFSSTTPTTHNGLAGLDGGEVGYYGHLTSADYTELTDWLGNVTLSGNGNLSTNGNVSISSILKINESIKMIRDDEILLQWDNDTKATLSNNGILETQADQFKIGNNQNDGGGAIGQDQVGYVFDLTPEVNDYRIQCDGNNGWCNFQTGNYSTDTWSTDMILNIGSILFGGSAQQGITVDTSTLRIYENQNMNIWADDIYFKRNNPEDNKTNIGININPQGIGEEYSLAVASNNYNLKLFNTEQDKNYSLNMTTGGDLEYYNDAGDLVLVLADNGTVIVDNNLTGINYLEAASGNILSLDTTNLEVSNIFRADNIITRSGSPAMVFYNSSISPTMTLYENNSVELESNVKINGNLTIPTDSEQAIFVGEIGNSFEVNAKTGTSTFNSSSITPMFLTGNNPIGTFISVDNTNQTAVDAQWYIGTYGTNFLDGNYVLMNQDINIAAIEATQGGKVGFNRPIFGSPADIDEQFEFRNGSIQIWDDDEGLIIGNDKDVYMTYNTSGEDSDEFTIAHDGVTKLTGWLDVGFVDGATGSDQYRSLSLNYDDGNGAGFFMNNQDDSRLPFVALTGYETVASGTATVYVGGGGWAVRDANQIDFYTDPTTNNPSADQGVRRMRIGKDGTVTFGGGASTSDQVVEFKIPGRLNDNIALDFGSGDDTELYWNTTDMIYNATSASHNFIGDVNVDGNISANYFFGNGSQLDIGESDLNVNSSTYANSSTWWAGLSGWVSGWFTQTGNELDFNETKLNETIGLEGVRVGFNSTYNATYDTWAYNQTTPAITWANDTIQANNASWVSTYNATYDAKADYEFGANNFNGSGNFTTLGVAMIGPRTFAEGGSIAHGEAGSAGFINATDGSFAGGVIDSSNTIIADGGSFAHGKSSTLISGSASLEASVVSFASGAAAAFLGNDGLMRANSSGSFASGVADQGNMIATSPGSFAQGYTFRGNIESSGRGSFAQGAAPTYAIIASEDGAFAHGYTDNGDIIASGLNSFAIGDDVEALQTRSMALGKGFINNISDTFMVGFSSTPALTVGDGYISINNETASSYPLQVYGNTSGISAWFETNISATGYNTRTELYDGDALASIYSSDYYKDNGTINHSKFGNCSSTYEKPIYDIQVFQEDRSNWICIYQEYEFENNEDITDENISCTYNEKIKNVTRRTLTGYENVTEVNLVCWTAKLEQALSQYKEVAVPLVIDVNNSALDTTTIMAENIYTKSKVPIPSFNYLDRFFNSSALMQKTSHYSNEVIGGQNRLNMEERIVSCEGALSQLSIELCVESNNKYSWC